ncbi:MAG TPA: riboflavin biosynthesis protein RibF [Candidatus Dormibacteraeota bacterium]|nr:riboflavin biosynthesis protein RibF [Candidatus Dormibacteraeota bacterium]
MRIRHDLDRRERGKPLALAIGFFDGFHLGHREIVRRTRATARLGWSVGVLTFRNHPATHLRPGSAPLLIGTLEERVNQLAAAGVDELFLVPFDDTLAPLVPLEFVDRVLVEALGVKALVVGENFRFAAKRSGDVAFLRGALPPRGIPVEGVPTVAADGERVSSTRIREAIAAGSLELVDAMLGRPYALRGRVCLGEGRGHALGWPTANLEPSAGIVLPKDGVYEGYARVDGRDYRCLLSVGTKPTFDAQRRERTLEAWLVDFQASVYGHEMELSRLRFLRDQVRFDSVDALLAQMEQDAQAVRFPTFF